VGCLTLGRTVATRASWPVMDWITRTRAKRNQSLEVAQKEATPSRRNGERHCAGINDVPKVLDPSTQLKLCKTQVEAARDGADVSNDLVSTCEIRRVCTVRCNEWGNDDNEIIDEVDQED
jgi:hypothetical protein